MQDTEIAVQAVRRALAELTEPVQRARRFAGHAEADGAQPPGEHEWAVRAYPTEQRGGQPWIWDRAGDLDHARLLVDGINKHAASLNDATREELGTQRAEVVSRWLFELADGTTITTPWQTHDEEG